ncbi:MAG: metal-binding protein [Acidimicrobiia bacterium]
MPGFRIDVADLLSRAGARRSVELSAELDDLVTSAARVAGPVTLAVRLERIPDGIVVRGSVRGRWRGECSSCLTDLERELDLHVDELFEAQPVEGETYPLEGHEIDLEQLVRDVMLLELPLAPHCDEPCLTGGGADGGSADAAVEAAPDPRWAALAELEIN